MDGWHKLRPYNLVVHGAVDGFSRTIVFMRCVDNNYKKTVLTSFLPAVRQYGLPRTVRVDKGGENFAVCDFMVEQRGLNNCAFIVGKSTHNQRIERMWGDLRLRCMQYYMTLFYELSDTHDIDFTDSNCAYVMHYLFLPLINSDLDAFVLAWNHHKLSSMHNKSPLWLMNNTPDNCALDFNVDEYLGLDIEQDDDTDEEEHPPQVEVHDIKCLLSAEQLVAFKISIAPFHERLNTALEYMPFIDTAIECYNDCVLNL